MNCLLTCVGLVSQDVEPLAAALPSYGDLWLRTLTILGVLILVVLGATRAVRRLGARQGATGESRHLQIVEALRVDARKRILLVRVGARHALIGVADGQLVELGHAPIDLGSEMNDATDVSSKRAFGTRLRDGAAVECAVPQ